MGWRTEAESVWVDHSFTCAHLAEALSLSPVLDSSAILATRLA